MWSRLRFITRTRLLTQSGAWSRTGIATTIPHSTYFILKPKRMLLFIWNRWNQRHRSSVMAVNLLAYPENRTLNGKLTPVFKAMIIDGVTKPAVRTPGNSSCKRGNSFSSQNSELNNACVNSIHRFATIPPPNNLLSPPQPTTHRKSTS